MSTVACDDRVGRRVELEVDLAPAAVGVDDEPLAVAEPGAVRDPRQAARAVAAHLGPAAVGVVQHHRAVGAVGARLDRDEPVGADAAVPVAERARRRPGASGATVRVERELDEEVVAGGVRAWRA